MTPRTRERPPTPAERAADKALQLGERARARQQAAPVEAAGPLGAGTPTSVQNQVGGQVLTPNFVAAAAAMSIPNNGRTIMYVKNGATAATTVTVVANATTPEGDTLANKVYTAQGTNTERVYGPFNTGLYNFADGTAEIRFSSLTGVTVAFISLPE